jgi:hypothetical protein
MMPDTNTDRDLAVLYWRLQRGVHTNPRIRSYLYTIAELMRRRRITPARLNAIGLEMVEKEITDYNFKI